MRGIRRRGTGFKKWRKKVTGRKGILLGEKKKRDMRGERVEG